MIYIFLAEYMLLKALMEPSLGPRAGWPPIYY
jgi:hypothetical protein